MSNAVESLMFVAGISASKLKTLVQRLDAADPQKVAGLIAGIEKESTVLSQAVQKLSGHIDAIREQEEDGSADSVPPEGDRCLLEVARLLRIADHGFTCPKCGGVRHDAGDHGRIEGDAVADEVAAVRARRAEAER